MVSVKRWSKCVCVIVAKIVSRNGESHVYLLGYVTSVILALVSSANSVETESTE